MSERRPLKVDPDEWPVIASADWHDGQVECQANNIRRIKVREHRDGRRIVYGFQNAGDGGQYAGTRNPSAGYLVEVETVVEGHGSPADMRRAYAARDAKRDEETVRAIRRVGGVLGDDALADECIASLPAEDI
ncbi:MAG: hypothetical protein NVS3B10_05720 [Polyangiales bacterium]